MNMSSRLSVAFGTAMTSDPEAVIRSGQQRLAKLGPMMECQFARMVSSGVSLSRW